MRRFENRIKHGGMHIGCGRRTRSLWVSGSPWFDGPSDLVKVLLTQTPESCRAEKAENASSLLDRRTSFERLRVARARAATTHASGQLRDYRRHLDERGRVVGWKPAGFRPARRPVHVTHHGWHSHAPDERAGLRY